jgi:hypothetical protein
MEVIKILVTEATYHSTVMEGVEAVAEIKDGGTRVKTECTVRVEQKEKLGINCCQNAKDF